MCRLFRVFYFDFLLYFGNWRNVFSIVFLTLSLLVLVFYTLQVFLAIKMGNEEGVKKRSKQYVLVVIILFVIYFNCKQDLNAGFPKALRI